MKRVAALLTKEFLDLRDNRGVFLPALRTVVVGDLSALERGNKGTRRPLCSQTLSSLLGTESSPERQQREGRVFWAPRSFRQSAAHESADLSTSLSARRKTRRCPTRHCPTRHWSVSA